MSFVVLVGNPKAGSRTLRVATAAADAVAGALGLTGSPQVIDLALLSAALLQDSPGPAVQAAVEQVLGADLLLVASPTFKGSYTGLLKVFLDRLPHRALQHATALPLLVMGLPQHALAVEVHLRPLLVELGATVPTPGLAVLESELDELDQVLGRWAALLAESLAVAARASRTALAAAG
jgi:FMN reductase